MLICEASTLSFYDIEFFFLERNIFHFIEKYYLEYILIEINRNGRFDLESRFFSYVLLAAANNSYYF